MVCHVVLCGAGDFRADHPTSARRQLPLSRRHSTSTRGSNQQQPAARASSRSVDQRTARRDGEAARRREAEGQQPGCLASSSSLDETGCQEPRPKELQPVREHSASRELAGAA